MVSFWRSICIWAKKIESKYKLNRLFYKYVIFQFNFTSNYYRFLNSKILSETKQLSEFDEWKLSIPIGDERVTIICCPEDLVCECPAGSHQSTSCCHKCQLPLCRECETSLTGASGPNVPPACLANDLMVFYAPTSSIHKKLLCSR